MDAANTVTWAQALTAVATSTTALVTFSTFFVGRVLSRHKERLEVLDAYKYDKAQFEKFLDKAQSVYGLRFRRTVEDSVKNKGSGHHGLDMTFTKLARWWDFRNPSAVYVKERDLDLERTEEIARKALGLSP